MSYPLRAVAAVTALGFVGAAVWAIGSGDSDAGNYRDPVTLGRIATVALTTEHDCSELLSHYRKEGARLVGPYGLNGGQILTMASGVAMAESRTTADASAVTGAASSKQAVPDSTTNVQVAGVDESDVVKTSGDLMVAVVNGAVRITRLDGADTTTLATWHPSVGSAQSLLLDGTTAVVIGDRNDATPLAATTKLRGPGPTGLGSAVTDLTVLDLADPAHPRPVRRLELGGDRSGEARLVDGELRLALTAGPTGIAWEQPVYPSMIPGQADDKTKQQADFKRSEKTATAANRKLIAKSTIANWIPQATVTALNAAGAPDGPAVSRPLVDCERVAIPGAFSGLSTLTLVSADLHADPPLTSWRSAAVIADGSTVYATADHVWLATSRWDPAPAADGVVSMPFAPTSTSTQIHRFDTPSRAQPKYVASGEIDGSLLNQFAMDEQDGLLRVASTTDGQSTPLATDLESSSTEGDSAVVSDGAAGDSPATATPGSSGPTSPEPSPTRKLSEGRVTVLRVDGDRLAQVGVVTGLGAGERIRGVRFVGDIGYVVTYRQTDPLYTVDLSDPARPQVRGELAVLGYSAYLHPAGEGRILGLGQDGTKAGASTGLQLSLFDVGDLDSPRRLDRERLAGAWSDAEGDHHAFTMAGDLVLIPYSSWSNVLVKEKSNAVAPDGSQYRERFDAGVIAVRVGPDGLGDPTTLRPIADGPVTFDGSSKIESETRRVTEAAPIRTVVHDGTIYTLTSSGVAAHASTAGFARLAFARF